MEGALTGLFNLIKSIVVESNEENLEKILIKVEKALILLKNDFIEQLLYKTFDEIST